MSEIKPKMNLLLPGEYCNNCPYFKPTVEKDNIYATGRKWQLSKVVLYFKS